MPNPTETWLAACPPDLLAFFKSVPVMNAIREFRKSTFQMTGRYDGAMSDECKASFQRQYAAIDQFVAALDSQ